MDSASSLRTILLEFKRQTPGQASCNFSSCPGEDEGRKENKPGRLSWLEGQTHGVGKEALAKESGSPTCRGRMPEVLRKECLECTEGKENNSENQTDPGSCMAVGPVSYCARGGNSGKENYKPH